MSESAGPLMPEPGAAAVPKTERPDGAVKRLYREEREAWRRTYLRYFKHAARALGLGFVGGFAFFSLWPAQEQKALELVVQALKDIPLGGSAAVLALTLLYHNARASVIAVAVGAVPFLSLSIFDPILNGGVLGLLASVSKHNGLDVPRLFLTQILPHGVFELTAVCYATAVGLHLSAGTGRKVAAAWRARRARKAGRGAAEPAVSLAPAGTEAAIEPAPPEPTVTAGAAPCGLCEPGLVRDAVRSFVLVVLPLLAVAALIEGFITPRLR
jgi:stage II sporulation protein M